MAETEDGQLLIEIKKATGYSIDKLELIAALNHSRDQYNKGYEDGLKAGKWIPVSVELPEEKGWYLTTTLYNEVYCDYWNKLNFERTEYVIAWMPLPTPYEP